MKRPRPDIGDILKAEFIKNMGNTRKFKRLWGTTSIGSTPVLNLRNYYFPVNFRSSNFEKLFRLLGAYDDVTSSSSKGIDRAWLYLNKNKGDSEYATEETLNAYKDFIAFNLETLWGNGNNTGKVLTTSIVIEDEFPKYVEDNDNTSWVDASFRSTRYLSTSWGKNTLITRVKNDYANIWNTALVSQQGTGIIRDGHTIDPETLIKIENIEELSIDDPWLDILARYSLLFTGETGVKVLSVEKGYKKSLSGHLCSTFVFDVEIPFFQLGGDSSIVQKIASDVLGSYPSVVKGIPYYPNGYYTKRGMLALKGLDDTSPINRNYRLVEEEELNYNAIYASLWQWSGGKPYLKAAAIQNPKQFGITHKELYSYITSCVDTDYKKKKVKWYKKALAVVIFVVSIIYLQPQLGYAAAIVVSSIVLNLISLAATSAGEEDWGQAFSETSATLEPLVTVASIYLLVTGLANVANDIAKKGVGTYLQDQTSSMVDGIVQGATDVISGSVTPAGIKFASSMVELTTLVKRNELERIGDRNKDLQSQYDKLNEEAYQENDALRGFARIYSKPATSDWSHYASLFDLPYERSGGALSLGNVQKTTKQAMRKASYDDSAFDNILLM